MNRIRFLAPLEMTGRGFTLLELLIVTAIIGTLSVCSISGLKYALGQRTMTNAAKQIVADLHYLRLQAMSTDQDSSFNFTTTGYAQTQDYTLPASVRPINQTYTNGISGSLVRLGFKPNGTPKYAGTVSLSGKGSKTYKISLAAVTGKISIK